MALTTYEIIWLRWLLANMGVYLKDPTPLHCDNKSVIHIAHNSIFRERTKHIETDCHFLLIIIFKLALYLYHLFLWLYRMQIYLLSHTLFYAFVFYLTNSQCI